MSKSQQHPSGRSTRALTVAAALGFCLVAFGQDTGGDPNNGYGPNDRPVFAFISGANAFDLPNIDVVDERLRNKADRLGSKVIMLKIGTFVAGDSIESTRYVSAEPATFDPDGVPNEPGPGTRLTEYTGNPLTMVGSFKTLEPGNSIHLMTPYPQPIAPHVQAAYFNASAFLENGGLGEFPTTVQVALFIYDNQGGAGASINEILQQIFFVDLAAPVVLVPPPPPPAPPVLSGGGIFFPHTPGEGIFGFDVDINLGAGVLDADVCLFVGIDVKPGNNNNTVNVKDDSGVLSIAVLSSEGFDASFELDPDTVVAVLIGTDGEVVNEVPAERFDIRDVNGDGKKDVIYKFSMSALVDGPNAPLTTFSTIITLRGVTFEGMSVQGSDFIRVVPN